MHKRAGWAGLGMAAFGLVACTDAGEAGADEVASSAEVSQYADTPDAGAAAYITPSMVRSAAGLVTEGRIYRLGIVTGRGTPVCCNRSYDIAVSELPLDAPNKVTGHDDRVTTHLGIGTQIDGLGHIGDDGIHYGGVPASDIMREDGLVRYGAENIPAIATRGVLIDMAAHFGVETMEPMAAFGAEDIRAAAAAQGVDIRRGDVVLFHTGWLAMLGDPETFQFRQPGLNTDGAQYLADLGVVAVGGDSPSLETMARSDAGEVIPVHALLIAGNGIYILENIDTRELAADAVHEFMFVLGVPRMEGSVQAMIDPVAIR